MHAYIRRVVLALVLPVAVAVWAVAPAVAAADFAVESFEKYDHEASAYTVPGTVNFVVLKKGSSDFVVWTKSELSSEELVVLESCARAHDPSLKSRNAIFLSGMGSHAVDTMYGTVTFAHGADGLAVLMPRQWSHLDYGRYTEEEPEPETGRLTITKTVDGRLWRVRCDYMDVEGQDTCDVRHISGALWKRDWISNPGGTTSLEGHRNNKCGDAEHWVIWADADGVAYRMDEIKSGATGGTLPTVVYRTEAEMTDEEIAHIEDTTPEGHECLEKYKRNFQTPMPYSKIRIGKRLYWITFNAGRVWYHSGIPYEDDPNFVLSVDGVPCILTGGQSVTLSDLEPGIHEISESENPLYTLGTVVTADGDELQVEDGWTVKVQIGAGDDVGVTWPNKQPEPRDPPEPPPPPETEPEPEPVIEVRTLCELLDFGQRFNAVVFGNLLTSGGDSEGALLVWGNATLSAGYSVGLGEGEAIVPGAARGDALIVGGDLVIGTQDVDGNVVYGGDYLGADRTWNDYALHRVAPVTLDRSGNVPADGSGRTAAEQLEAVTEVSDRVAEWEADGTVSSLPDGSLLLTGTNGVRNVFAVTAEQWSGSQRDWIFDVPVGSKVVVNVAGGFVELAYGRMVLPDGVTQEDVLVNYADATFLSFTGINHEGSVLAPRASGSFTGGAIEGIAILGGDVAAKDGFEFHDFGLDVFFCPVWPEVSITATAEGAADGRVWTAEPGAQVTVHVLVANPSAEYTLRNVKLADSTGAVLSLGELAPGASTNVVLYLTADEAGRVDYTATVTAAAYAGGVVFADRPAVTATDAAAVVFAEGAGEGAVVPEDVAGESAPATERVDYAIDDGDMWFSCIPTFAGERFTVNVRVRNVGELDGDGAVLGLYLVDVGHGAAVDGEDDVAPVRTIEMGRIPAGGSRVYSFGGLEAPAATNGTFRVIAFADMEDVQREWSDVDNQNNLTYELSLVDIRLEITPEGVILTWSNGWGQIYAILGSNDLEAWEEIETENWVSGIGPDGSGGIPSARDTLGLVENTEFVSYDTGFRFFKLRVKQR